GERFFYDNPLASRGNHHRWIWHRCPCCPPNIARLVASLGSYLYSTAPGELAVHLYAEGDVRAEVDGIGVRLGQATNYPWDGVVKLRVTPDKAREFALRLRIPGWCRSVHLAVNGEANALADIVDRGYAHVRRLWRPGDQVSLGLEMPPERVYAHPDVRADQGRVALKRGPIVYCLEGVDNATPVQRLALPRQADIGARFEPSLLGGCAVLSGAALALQPSGDALYGPRRYGTEPTRFTAVPYHLWDHREPGEMTVWLPEA